MNLGYNCFTAWISWQAALKEAEDEADAAAAAQAEKEQEAELDEFTKVRCQFAQLLTEKARPAHGVHAMKCSCIKVEPACSMHVRKSAWLHQRWEPWYGATWP